MSNFQDPGAVITIKADSQTLKEVYQDLVNEIKQDFVVSYNANIQLLIALIPNISTQTEAFLQRKDFAQSDSFVYKRYNASAFSGSTQLLNLLQKECA